MRPTIPIEQRPLLAGQVARPAAINVGAARPIGLDNIVGREHPEAAHARWLSHHVHRLGGRPNTFEPSPTPVGPGLMTGCGPRGSPPEPTRLVPHRRGVRS